VEPGGRAVAFKCAGCGAPIEKHVAATEVVACGSCGSVTDVTGTVGELVQKNELNERALKPAIPLGTTGTGAARSTKPSAACAARSLSRD